MRTSAVQRDPVRQEHNSYNVTESLEDSNQMGPAPSIMARLIPRVNDLVPTDDELASVPNDDVTSFENPADKSEVLGDQGDQVRNMSKVTAVPQGSNDSAIQVSSVADKKNSRDQPLGHQSDAEATTTDDSMPFPAMDDNSSRSEFPSTSLSTLPRTNSEAATLKILSDFLTSQEGIAQHLDEEKVVAYTHSIHRDAKDRTRLRKNLVEDFEVLTDRDAVYDRIYSEEEHLATASHMFHEIVDFASLKAAVRLDSRTLKWLKRATGLHKNNNLLDQNNDGFSDLEEGETEGSARRMTRGVKKERQKQRMRKETEGLSIFIDVIKEIEKERGLPVVSNTQFYPTSEEDTTQDESAYDEADNYIDRRIASGFCVRDYPPKSELIARIQSRLLSVRLIFRGNVISRANRMELEEWHRSKKRRRQIEENDSEEWIAQPERKKEFVPLIIEKEKSQTQLELYTPSIEDNIAKSMNLFKPKPDDPFTPFPHPLKNTNIFRFYGSEARWWASHEFFYPDLDAAWYKFDPHAALIASLVPPGVELTWRQWKMIRRQFNRPRRFSQTFITSQLSKRNRFRRMIRKLQRHSDSGKTHNFPVPPILQPGTTVKAYIRRSRIVSKGNVLFYSPGDHGYMVQFDAEELGCEFCPDTDVARFSTRANASVPGSGNTSSRASNHSPLDAPVLLENDPFYERYSLVSLIATIERAKERKKVILDAMQENNRFVFPSLRSNLANSFEPHTERWDAFQRSSSAWLHANLILTNQSLQESLELLRSLYLKKLALPKISSSPVKKARIVPREDTLDKNELKSIAHQLILSVGSTEGSKTFQDCAEALLEVEMRKVLANVPRE